MFKVGRDHDARHAAAQAVQILDDTGDALAAAFAAFGQQILRLVAKDVRGLGVMVRLVRFMFLVVQQDRRPLARLAQHLLAFASFQFRPRLHLQ